MTGATGYMGRALCSALARRGHRVRALARAGSESRVPANCDVVTGDALQAATFHTAVAGCDTLVHLVGVAHPSPAKAAQFETIDLASVRAAVQAASGAKVRHFVYVSVAQPAPMMHAYQAARAKGEQSVQTAGFECVQILRPWYVLGPGHWWPVALIPIYQVMEWIPATRERARRLGLVWHSEMVAALLACAENAQPGIQVLGVPEIRAAGEVSKRRLS